MAVLYEHFPGFLKGWKVVRLVPTPLKLTGQAVRKPDLRLMEEVLTNEVSTSWRSVYMASCGNLCYIHTNCTFWKLIQIVFTPSKWSSLSCDRLPVLIPEICVLFWTTLIISIMWYSYTPFVHLVFPFRDWSFFSELRQTYGFGSGFLICFFGDITPAFDFGMEWFGPLLTFVVGAGCGFLILLSGR